MAKDMTRADKMRLIDTLTLRERAAGLMRGSRKQLQLGYRSGSAAYAALHYERGFENEVDKNDPILVDDLYPYAEGFADGLADTLERSPDRGGLGITETFVRSTDNPEYVRTRAYEDGHRQGRREHAPSLYPALSRRPRPDLIQRFPDGAA